MEGAGEVEGGAEVRDFGADRGGYFRRVSSVSQWPGVASHSQKFQPLQERRLTAARIFRAAARAESGLAADGVFIGRDGGHGAGRCQEAGETAE